MSAFGGRLDEPMLTDQIDDEYDVMNDETFGGDVPTDEWEADQIASELEAAEARAVAAASAAADRSLLDFAASRLPISDDPLDFLEQSISQMVADDDDVLYRGKKSSTGADMKPMTNIFAPGSPQTPFFQFNDRGSIWSDALPSASSKPKAQQPSASSSSSSAGQPAVSMAAVTGLMERMRANGGGPPQPPEPVLVKGAKTAEELEAELLGKPTTPKGPTMKSCEELEREMLENSSRSSSTNAMVAAQMMMMPAAQQQLPPELQQQLQQQMMMSGGGMGQQQMPGMMIRPPPNHPLANPQVRAALLARWMAANPGAQPPVWFRMPPPAMMPPPPPGAGFRPPITIRPGTNVMPPNMNFPNAPPRQPVPVPDFRTIMLQQQAAAATAAQGRRPMPPQMNQQQQFVRRHQKFDPRDYYSNRGDDEQGGRYYQQQHRNDRGGDREFYHHQRGDRNDRDHYHRDRDRDRDYYHNRDPFAGLMSRRERSWLIKIQTLQLYSENPYVDDYYWMMYRRRRMATDGSAVYKDTDHNDNFEHRVYVPPIFEGSLGKLQVLSANFPRQVLDLSASAPETDPMRQQSVDEGGSPRDSPPSTRMGGQHQQPAQTLLGGRRLKNVLIEMENLYVMLLEANDLTIMREQIVAAAAASAASDEDGPQGSGGLVMEDKEKATARAKTLIETIVSTLISEERMVTALAIRKGRRLLIQLMIHCDKDECMKIMQAVLRNLLPLSKKEPNQEILLTIKTIFDSKLTNMDTTEWTNLWDCINAESMENIVKYKTGAGILLLLIQRSAMDGVKLEESAAKIVERWASVAFTNSNNNKESDGQSGGIMKGSTTTTTTIPPPLEKEQADRMCSWLRSSSGASIPSTVVDAIASTWV